MVPNYPLSFPNDQSLGEVECGCVACSERRRERSWQPIGHADLPPSWGRSPSNGLVCVRPRQGGPLVWFSNRCIKVPEVS
jgi:hypothetical protein